MSGIYIPGMEMPDRCFSCPMCDTNCCGISRGSYIEYRDIEVNVALQERPDWCPLVPVPEHGDLKDSDALGVLSWNTEDEGDFEDGVLFVLNKLEELPVIIPGDQKKEATE